MPPRIAEPISYAQPEPTRIRVGWKGQGLREYEARPLRLECPCASCIDEMTGRPLLDPGTVPQDLTIQGCNLVGRYAFQFVFSDGHQTGLYTFAWLLDQGREIEEGGPGASGG